MKNWIKWMDRKVRKDFTIWDMGFLKTYGAIFGLIIGALFPAFILKNLWLFVGLFVILMFRFLYLLFVKDDLPAAGLFREF